MQPTLRQLNYLSAIKSEGSFSRAADICHVTQSTLSAGIKELEDIIGHKLVERGKRNVRLTGFGEEVARAAREIDDKLGIIRARAAQLNKPMSGPLRLGVIPTIAPYLLPKILPTLQKKFPSLEIQLHEDLTGRLLDQIDQGRLDLVLMAFPYTTPGMEQSILFREPFVLACSKREKKPKAMSFAALENENLLLLEDGHCLRDHALDACKLKRPKERSPFSATSLPTLIQMVQHGYGSTLLPEMVAYSAPMPGNIALIPFEKPFPTRDIGFAWATGSAKAQDFRLLARTVKELQKS